jgi:S1-C subfamily serine protease
VKLKLGVGAMVFLAGVCLVLLLQWTGILTLPKRNQVKTTAYPSASAGASDATRVTDVPEIPRPERSTSPAATGRAEAPTVRPRRSPPQEAPGEIAGIGAALKMTDGEVIIVSTISGSPAEKAGLLAGWIVDKVDGTSLRDRPLAECIQMVRGAVGTKVKLELVEPTTNERRTYEVTRDRILLQ